MALEHLLATQATTSLLGDSGTSARMIPICFKQAMQALSYMGDVIFKDITSIEYSNSYNGTEDKMEPDRITQWENIRDRTNKLLKTHGVKYPPNFSHALKQMLDICQQWYGFKPRINEHEIQFFEQLGLTATDVARDGHCFFHALYELIDGYTFEELIDLAVELTGDEKIRDPDQWVHLNFQAIANALAQELGLNIVLVQQNTIMTQVDQMLVTNFANGGVAAENTVFIGNIGNMHFVALHPIADDNTVFQEFNEHIVAHIAGIAAESSSEEVDNLALGEIKLEDQEEEESSDSDEGGDTPSHTVGYLLELVYDNPQVFDQFNLSKNSSKLSINEQYIIDQFINGNKSKADYSEVELKESFKSFEGSTDLDQIVLLIGKLMSFMHYNS